MNKVEVEINGEICRIEAFVLLEERAKIIDMNKELYETPYRVITYEYGMTHIFYKDKVIYAECIPFPVNSKPYNSYIKNKIRQFESASQIIYEQQQKVYLLNPLG